MRGRLCVVLVAMWLVLTASVDRAQAPGASDLRPQARAAHLRHGVNLSDWFRQLPDGRSYTKEHFETSVTAEDLALIRAMGFDHVRLPVNPQPLFRPLQADRIPPEPLAYVDAAIRMILDAGLSVQLDIQADDAFKRRLSDDAFVEQFADFWRALARHYSALDPERVFFEILNEPEVRDPYRWYGIETKLATAIRESAPGHTIIATGAQWSDEDNLLFIDPLRDANVIYAFHFYEPFLFTHQGATWAENYWHFLQGVPYPSNPEGARRAAARVPDAVHRLAVLRYGASHWDAERVDLEISQVAEWAGRWNVSVVCNEFGVYRQSADAGERAAWLADVRTSLEKHGLGWTMWEYSGGFGVVTKQSDQSSPDASTVRALGMTMPAVVTRAAEGSPK
jgi:aryl-phospho-beta-D-glucosidase BglC (GH1 family)